jgi:hypothetical protein
VSHQRGAVQKNTGDLQGEFGAIFNVRPCTVERKGTGARTERNRRKNRRKQEKNRTRNQESRQKIQAAGRTGTVFRIPG